MSPEIDTPEIVKISDMIDVDIKQELKDNGVFLHHKTGLEKLATTLAEVRAGTYIAPVASTNTPPQVKGPTAAATKAMEDSKILTKEQRALRLQRIVVSPNDPLMSSYTGLIFTVGSSSVNKGRMIKKFVPFNNDKGWHVPQIIIDQIEAAQMQKFKSITMPNGQKVMHPYITKKFNVQILPPLTLEEMKSLAASQQAKGANV